MKIPALVAVVFTVALQAGMAHAVTVTDPSDWASGWTYSQVEVANGGTATFAVLPTGGNPNARLESTTVTATATAVAFGAARYTTTVLPAPASGAPYTMTIDVLSGPGGFGQGQGVQLLVEQGGSLYVATLGITGFPLTPFTTLSFNGTFTAGLFTRVAGAGPAQPAFDGVTPTTFGFAVGNGNSGTLVQYYDNWRLTFADAVPVGPAQAVPTLSDAALLLLALLVAGAALFARSAPGRRS